MPDQNSNSSPVLAANRTSYLSPQCQEWGRVLAIAGAEVAVGVCQGAAGVCRAWGR